MRFKLLTTLIISSIGMTACSVNEVHKNKMPTTDSVMTTFSKDLLVVAQNIRTANKQTNLLLLQNNQAKSHQLGKDLVVKNVPKKLNKKITLNWAGQPEKVVSLIASLIGYHYLPVTGKAPTPSLMVNVSVIEKPAFEVLKDVGVQMGDKAMLIIDPRLQTIQIAYLGK